MDGYFANDYQRKGLQALLEALKAIKTQSIHLMLPWNDKPDKFAESVSAVGLRNQMHFIEKCNDMYDLYPTANILVHPTRVNT